MAEENDVEDEAKAAAGSDPKARFREALERKKQGVGAGPGAQGAKGGVGTAHGKAGGKREFRRKSS